MAVAPFKSAFYFKDDEEQEGKKTFWLSKILQNKMIGINETMMILL